MYAHLFFQRGTEDGIALAGLAVFGRDELGYDEKGNALRAGRRAWQTREDQMNDVVGQVVLAGRDEDLGSRQLERAILLRIGLRAQQAEIGAALRLGQAHGAGP